MATSEIANFVFFELLRLDPLTSLIRGDVGRDILFVIVIPADVGLLLFYEVTKIILKEHGSLRMLFGIGGLGAVIYLGFYELLARWAFLLFIFWFGFAIFNRAFIRTVGEGGHKVLWGLGGWLGRRGRVMLSPGLHHEIEQNARDLVGAIAENMSANQLA